MGQGPSRNRHTATEDGLIHKSVGGVQGNFRTVQDPGGVVTPSTSITPATEVSRQERGHWKLGIEKALQKRAPSRSCDFRRGTRPTYRHLQKEDGGVPSLSSLCSPAGGID